jgi:hypothetical protein
MQRAPREFATYALIRVRSQVMRSLWIACGQEAWPPADLQHLTSAHRAGLSVRAEQREPTCLTVRASNPSPANVGSQHR